MPKASVASPNGSGILGIYSASGGVTFCLRFPLYQISDAAQAASQSWQWQAGTGKIRLTRLDMVGYLENNSDIQKLEDKHMTKATNTFLAAWLVLSLAVPPVDAQTELGVVIKKHYSLRSVSCNGCHCQDEEEKTSDNLTPFGLVIAKLIEGHKITERLNTVKELEEEEKELVKEAIEKEFTETIKKLDVVKDPGGKTYAERIQAGEIDGLRPRK